MLEEVINIPHGSIVIYAIDSLGNKSELLNCHNAILGGAKKMLSRSLGGLPNYDIKQMSIFNGDTLLATANRNIPATFPADTTDKVVFICRFSQTSFSGPFNRITLEGLENTSTIVFSEVTGLIQSKPIDIQIEIQWQIAFNK